MAIELGLANKSGSWFTYGDRRIGQGRENAKQFLDDNLDVMAELESRIRAETLSDGSGQPLTTFEVDSPETLALAV